MAIIKADQVTFEYLKHDEEGRVTGKFRALDQVSLDIEPGQFITILGHNGSGKSTFAKHLNALLFPTEGTVWIDGMNTQEDAHLLDVRQTAGMVFQNPDNQIICSLVEEEVGFGPENMGVPTEEIWERVADSLKAVGMYQYRKTSPNKLSGGQKQRVAIAGIVAMHPKCIVLDEPTAMLDPHGRRDVIRVLHELNEKEHVTVILITHYMEEVIDADHVFVMDQGKIVMQGTPREIFSRVEEMKKLRLDVPQVTELAYELNEAGLPMQEGILTNAELLEALRKQVQPSAESSAEPSVQPSAESSVEETDSTMEKRDAGQKSEKTGADNREETDRKMPVLRVSHLAYTYETGTSYEKKALVDVNCSIYQGEFIGLIGHTGSGKSTFIQHLNGLMKGSGGDIFYKEQSIYADQFDMRMLRSKVGLVFQYPEHQLFETDILKDVCFGPKNLGLPEAEVLQRAKDALQMVGLGEEFYASSPFDLSGGQKRRAAIAGVLAMHPEVLILDEPTAGLDPRGRDEILHSIRRLQKDTGITVILVSHSMEDVAEYVDRIMVMDNGRLRYDDTPKLVFRHIRDLEEIGLAAPQVTYIMDDLARAGYAVDTDAITIREARDSILSLAAGEDR